MNVTAFFAALGLRFRNTRIVPGQTPIDRTAEAAAAARARTAAAEATRAAREAAAQAANEAAAQDEVKRLNYYTNDDFARYQAARAARVRDVDGYLPWIDFNDYITPCPTIEQWAPMTDAQKNTPGLVRF